MSQYNNIVLIPGSFSYYVPFANDPILLEHELLHHLEIINGVSRRGKLGGPGDLYGLHGSQNWRARRLGSDERYLYYPANR